MATQSHSRSSSSSSSSSSNNYGSIHDSSSTSSSSQGSCPSIGASEVHLRAELSLAWYYFVFEAVSVRSVCFRSGMAIYIISAYLCINMVSMMIRLAHMRLRNEGQYSVLPSAERMCLQ